MRTPDDQTRRANLSYQSAVLGISALIIAVTMYVGVRAFQGMVAQPSAVAQGLLAAGQVIGAAGPRGPAAESLPGMAGTPTASATPGPTVTRTPLPTRTPMPTLTATATPDVRHYDAARAKTLLAQAQTTWGEQGSIFQSNVAVAAARLNGQRIAPDATFSFNAFAGPYTAESGYKAAGGSATIAPVEGGITQVSTTLFQAVFWSGLKIDLRKSHPSWLARFNAGSTGQPGLDAMVGEPASTADFRFVNNSGDWIRLETTTQPGTLTVSIYGADPGWSVHPTIGAPSRLVQPDPTQVVRQDAAVPPGQQIVVAKGAAGFEVEIQRSVTREGQEIDRYGVVAHYAPVPGILAVGPTPTPVVIPSPQPTVPSGGPVPGPVRLAGLDPRAFVQADGQIKVPNLIGLPEAEAQAVIEAVGLSTTYVNYQGPGDVPFTALQAVEVGRVLSQTPSRGSVVQRGATIFIAVRKQ